jgi:hypothetical protein
MCSRIPEITRTQVESHCYSRGGQSTWIDWDNSRDICRSDRYPRWCVIQKPDDQGMVIIWERRSGIMHPHRSQLTVLVYYLPACRRPMWTFITSLTNNGFSDSLFSHTSASAFKNSLTSFMSLQSLCESFAVSTECLLVEEDWEVQQEELQVQFTMRHRTISTKSSSVNIGKCPSRKECFSSQWDGTTLPQFEYEVSIISGTSAAIYTAVVVEQCNGRW